MSRTERDPTLLSLTALAVVLAVGHHVDHAIRGNHVGWPLTGDVNAFTFSLAIYPAIAIGLVLYLAGRVGPGFWAFLSGGGAAFLAFVHFGPQALEPPGDIIDVHASPLVGWIAFAWLLALVAVLLGTFAYELRRWAASRGRAARH